MRRRDARPNTRLQPTWPRLKERTPDYDCRFPAKIVFVRADVAKRLSRQSLGRLLLNE
jgi:hypothetical protein